MPAKAVLFLFLGLVLSGCAPRPVSALALPETAASPTPMPTPTARPAPTAAPSPAANPSPAPTIILSAEDQAAYSDAPLAASGCNESLFVNDVTVPDGTEFAAGEAFTKTWELKNIGTCTWNKAYSMVFVSGDRMDGLDRTIDRAVMPGETVKVSLDLVAPGRPGTYTGYWILADKAGTSFGEQVYVKIIVSANAG